MLRVLALVTGEGLRFLLGRMARLGLLALLCDRLRLDQRSGLAFLLRRGTFLDKRAGKVLCW